MSDPYRYDRAIEFYDTIKLADKVKKRLVRDGSGNWHTLEQLASTLREFDDLVGIATIEKREPFAPNFETSREIVEESVQESKRSGLPLDMCFQNVVMRRAHEKVVELVRREEDGEE